MIEIWLHEPAFRQNTDDDDDACMYLRYHYDYLEITRRDIQH